MPRPGDLSVVLAGDGEPLCVIRTTGVDVRTFAAVDEDFAWAEGEGDRSLTHWRTVNLTFFASEGRPADDDTEVVTRRFELLSPRRSSWSGPPPTRSTSGAIPFASQPIRLG